MSNIFIFVIPWKKRSCKMHNTHICSRTLNVPHFLTLVFTLTWIGQQQNYCVSSLTHELGFCADAFKELDGVKPKNPGNLKIEVTSPPFTNYLHVTMKRKDGSTVRVEGAVVQAIDLSGLPVGRFGLYECTDDSKPMVITRDAEFWECSMPSEKYLEHPNLAVIDRRSKPAAKEVHLTWRFSNFDKTNVDKIQFVGMIVVEFNKTDFHAVIRSDVITVTSVPKSSWKLPSNKKDLNMPCHGATLSPQFTTSQGTFKFNDDYSNKIKAWKKYL